MDMRDIMSICEDQPTTGTLPAKELAQMLPDIDNPTLFMSALEKVTNGQEDNISIQEQAQLAKAFTSLIKLPDAKKTLVVQKMMPITQQQSPQQPTNQTPQRL